VNRLSNWRGASLLATAALAGCAVGPNYRAPGIEPAAKAPFKEVAAPGTLSGQPLPPDWWVMFDDDALNALVRDALAYNTDIRQAVANVRKARGVLSEARAGRLPSTDLSAGYSRERVGADNSGAIGSGVNPGAGPSHEDFNYYQVGFDASYEIDLFGRVSRSIEAARGDAQASQAALDAVRISIIAQVAQSYADACGDAAQAEVARETARLEGDTLRLTKRLLEAGRGTRRDVDQAEVLVEQADAQVPDLEAERRAQLYALAALTGRLPSQVDAAAARCHVVPRVVTPIPIGDGASLLARRPDVRQAERTLAADTARIGIATAALYPSITLAGAASLGAPHVGDLGKAASFNYAFGPLISWSFPNIAVARARIRQSRSQAEASLAAFQGTMLTALKETEQALARSAAAQQQNASLKRAADAADDAARLSRLRFDQGRDNFLNLLVAEQDRAAARRALAQSDSKVADAQISVFKALGGGWEAAPALTGTAGAKSAL
jgi:NodT family efflux transporter outer membrane factor (OMF) lipoprotein